MGQESTIVIRHGGLEQIEKDPNFGRNLARAIRQHGMVNRPFEVAAGNHSNAAQVIETHNDSQTAVVTVGGGHGICQTTIHGWRHTEDHFKRELVEQWAQELGLKVVDADGPKPTSSGPGM